MNNSSDQPATKQQKIASPIDDLADEDLLNIFQHLPPFQRLRISEVCKRWYKLGRIPWHDIVNLDISSRRRSAFSVYRLGPGLEAVIKLCPNLRTVSIHGTSDVRSRELPILSRIPLLSLKLCNYSGTADEASGRAFELFLSLFSDHLPNASWDELVLHDLRLLVYVEAYESCYGCRIAGTLPTSLKRLQLSGGLRIRFDGDLGEWKPNGRGFLGSLPALRNLTCLILSSSPKNCLFDWDMHYVLPELKALSQLVELCVRVTDALDESQFEDATKLAFTLPKLEVLFFGHVIFAGSSEECLIRLATKHPTLKILVIAGVFEDKITVPARRLYPNGFGSDPLPLLRVFLDVPASRSVTFTESSADVLQLYPITEPLPAFLEKAEIAPLFDGVWIAAQIKEGAKYGAELLECCGDASASIRIIANGDE